MNHVCIKERRSQRYDKRAKKCVIRGPARRTRLRMLTSYDEAEQHCRSCRGKDRNSQGFFGPTQTLTGTDTDLIKRKRVHKRVQYYSSSRSTDRPGGKWEGPPPGWGFGVWAWGPATSRPHHDAWPRVPH
ncbi:unnamed protein product [Calypogeia fissa]